VSPPRDADEHRHVIDALRAGDAHGACACMRAHVHTSAHAWAGSPRRPRSAA